jgi:hypothetical protein
VSEQESTVSTIGAGGKFEINNQLVNNDNLLDVINRTIDRLITGLLSSLQHYLHLSLLTLEKDEDSIRYSWLQKKTGTVRMKLAHFYNFFIV